MRLIATLAVVGLLLIGCGTEDAALDARSTTTSSNATTSSSEPPVSQLDGETPITAFGIGPLEAGMTLADVREGAGRELILNGFEDFGGFCWIADVEGLEEDFDLLFLSPSDEPAGNPDEGVLGRVSAYADIDESPAMTDQGIGIGSTKADIEAAYPGEAEVTPHKYVEGGEYLDIGAVNDGDERLLRFETDGDAKVTAIHGGLPDAAQLVEGCA